MTLTLTPDLEAAIAEQARRQGTTVEQLVHDSLWQVLVPSDPPADAGPHVVGAAPEDCR